MSRVLIVESEPGLGQAWKRHLEAEHVRVSLARGQQEAVQDEAEQVVVRRLGGVWEVMKVEAEGKKEEDLGDYLNKHKRVV